MANPHHLTCFSFSVEGFRMRRTFCLSRTGGVTASMHTFYIWGFQGTPLDESCASSCIQGSYQEMLRQFVKKSLHHVSQTDGDGHVDHDDGDDDNDGTERLS